MKITTRTGDSGRTDLLFGGRAPKDSLRIEAVGALDELNSFLGLAKCEFPRGRIRKVLETLQNDLIVVSSELVVRKGRERKLEFRVDRARLDRLEKMLAGAESRVPALGCCFLIPGENRRAALLDVCRTVARRAERRVVVMKRRKLFANPLVPAYLNRLSDLLYLLARAQAPRSREFTPS